ncbi:MAG: glycogen synthase GlgA [Myxococcales bacterium]|nr:glycogen synthase GlgA [Myxococcales bacterium]
MKILVVAAEAVPFAKTGGLADVAGVLPKVLADLGHEVRVVMPRYWGVDRRALAPVGGPLGVPMGIIGTQWGAVLEGRLPGSDVPVWFIDHEQYFGRKHPYNEADGTGYPDNDNRFVFLSRAALEAAKMLDFRPDVVHVHDWHTAAAPIFLNTVYAHDPFFAGTASVLTIHNLQYQGQFFSGLMDVLGVGWAHFNHLELAHHDQVNLLKGGLYHATLINAVSPTYAREIRTPEFGYGLEGVVRDRAWALRGILNGVDYEDWNPAVDPHLPAHFDVGRMDGKAVCKAELQFEVGLPVRADVPVIGMVTRLVHQKGIDVLLDALPEVLGWDVQVVLLGSGERWAHEAIERLGAQGRRNFAYRLGYDDGLAHRIEAGSDLYVMPSRFEPCGLNQIYSLRYGTPPIVHAVGGLHDTVDNYDAAHGTGTGFKFHHLSPGALRDTIGWAVHTWFERKADFAALVERGMRQRFTWDHSARAYLRLYEDAIRRVRG